jgi:hypothetical protein
VTVTVKQGASTVQTRTASCSAGSYSVAASPALAQGTYTGQAAQTDAAGNTGTSSTNTFTVDTTSPTISSVSINNKTGGALNKPEAGDTIVLTYSETLKMTSICSTSTLGNSSSGSITPNATSTTVTLTKGSGGTDPMSLSSTDCTLHIGTFVLGSHYVGGASGSTLTFAGSSVAWDGSSKITVTLGSTVNGSAATAGGSVSNTITPDTNVTDPSGNAMSGTAFPWTATNF